MPIPYYHIDSFANELFAGNPAGICLVPAFPTNDVMQKIAAENRHSETAFVVDHAEIVRKLEPDTAAFAKIDMGISGGAIVTASGDNDVDYVCRFFAPSDGIDEDAATGSIQ